MKNNTKIIKYIIYTLVGFLYGILLWSQSLILQNLKNKNPNSLLGVDIKISNSHLKALIITFIMSLLYTIKDIYEFA